MMDSLARYRLPMRPAAKPVLQAVVRGVVRVPDFPGLSKAQDVLGAATPPADQVLRAQDGRVRITCTTDLPGVTPAMIDWWFGWHLPSSERYALWHPRAHVKAVVKEDRSHCASDRERYIGNVSYVDEYIGTQLRKLAIAFVPPESVGIELPPGASATAVCAHTSDRVTHGQGGSLVHYVVATPAGAQMRSGFWLGDIRLNAGPLDHLLHGALNSHWMRRLLISDQMALDLLLHCGEEMAHLARFLPQLHADVQAGLQTRADAMTQMQRP